MLPAHTMASQLARSDSVTTGTSYETDINEKSAAKPPAQALPAITEGEEDDNVGYNVYKQGLAEHELTPEENGTIRWRIDLIVLPMFLITQTLQFLDVRAFGPAVGAF